MILAMCLLRTKYSYYHPMESLETQQKAIELGKQLVIELRHEPEVDTLSRWMVHYIAEQITLAETASGNEKAAAEERCFQTIVSLWDHRTALPSGRRPFESFEPILRALASLDPEERRPYYHQIARPDKRSGEGEPDPTQALVDFIFAVDSSARILIQAAVDEAVEKATSEQTLAID